MHLQRAMAAEAEAAREARAKVTSMEGRRLGWLEISPYKKVSSVILAG